MDISEIVTALTRSDLYATFPCKKCSSQNQKYFDEHKLTPENVSMTIRYYRCTNCWNMEIINIE